MKNYIAWIYHQSFHRFFYACEWSNKHVTQSIHPGIMFVKALEHPSCGNQFCKKYRSTKSSSGWWILLGEDPQVKDILSLIPHIVWIHGQGLTSLGHNQYIGILFIQVSEYQSCVTRFGESWKMLSSMWCILLHEEPNTINVFPPIL